MTLVDSVQQDLVAVGGGAGGTRVSALISEALRA